MEHGNIVLSAAEVAMIEAFRVLPPEIRGALHKTIEQQANHYKPGRGAAGQPRLSLVAGCGGR